MSTKIYDAYKYTGQHKDLNTVLSVISKISEEVQENAKKEVLAGLARKAWRLKDLNTFYGEEFTEENNNGLKLDKYEWKALKAIRDKKDDLRLSGIFFYLIESYAKDLDNEYASWLANTSIVLIPCNRRIFAMVFGNVTLLCGTSFHNYFDDYHYQNQTDRPDNISAAEWSRRKKDWDIALGPDYIPKHHGLHYDLYDLKDSSFRYSMLFDSKELCKEALAEAENNIGQRVRDVRDTLPCPLMENVNSYVEASSIMQKPEFKAWIQEKNKEVADKLGVTMDIQ